jgi:lysophospholipase L1-like esterase
MTRMKYSAPRVDFCTPWTLRGWTHVERSALSGWLAACLLALGSACSSGSGVATGTGGHAGAGTGGVSTTGGTTTSGSGGVVATGGSRTGGTTGAAGSPASGGAPGTGGANTGGANTGETSGGGAGSGGAGSGGAFATGGANATGGRTGAGGTTGAGGATGGGGGGGGGSGSGGNATGGMTSTGGTQGTGGARPDGGPDVGQDLGGGDTGNAYSPCPATPGTACAILPLGDSITEGCCVSPMGGYRIELFHQALTNGKNITFVGSLTNGPATVDNKTFPQHHEGHGGYTIDSGTGHNGISGQITDNALSSYKPNIVLLMIGTNDINGNIDTANAPTRLGNLIDDITTKAPSALLVVASIIPSKTDGTNTNFQKYNAAIPGLVDTRAKAGKHVVFLDNYKVFSANASYKTAWMYDNLHPNDAGYVALGQSWYGVIGPLLP